MSSCCSIVDLFQTTLRHRCIVHRMLMRYENPRSPLRDSQSSLQYLRSLVTDHCTRKWSQRDWTHPIPRVAHLTKARHPLHHSDLRDNSSITPTATISSVRYSVTICTVGASRAADSYPRRPCGVRSRRPVSARRKLQRRTALLRSPSCGRRVLRLTAQTAPLLLQIPPTTLSPSTLGDAVRSPQ